ncbi:MAG: hypothetical protein V4613_10330 [Bacteroidota bacterium]
MDHLAEEIEVKNKKISGLSTAVICTLMVLGLLLMHFKVDAPEIDESGGVAVSLGDPEAGGPDEVPVEAYQPPTEPTFEPREAVEETTDPDAVAVPKSPEEVKKKPEVTKPVEPEEDDLIKKMRQKAQTSGTPANGGSGTKPGVGGSPDGVLGGKPDGTGGTSNSGPGGPGVGDGVATKSVSHTFGTRKMILATNTQNCGEGGTVKVDVIVKSDGSISVVGINPSTKSSSTCLHELAKKFVSKSKFAPSADGSSDEGTITIKFTLN